MEATIAAESAATGRRSTRWLVGKARGRRGQPAMPAAWVGCGAAKAAAAVRPATAASRERVRRAPMREETICRAQPDLSSLGSANTDRGGSSASLARHAYEPPARPADEAIAQPGAPAPTGPL